MQWDRLMPAAVFAFLILKEKMNGVRWLSFAIAIIGVILISTGDIQQLNFSSKYAVGNMLVFAAIVSMASSQEILTYFPSPLLLPGALLSG